MNENLLIGLVIGFGVLMLAFGLLLLKRTDELQTLTKQIDELKYAINGDNQWFAGDEMAQMFLSRYRDILDTAWRTKQHDDSVIFFRKVQKVYREGWRRFDSTNNEHVLEMSRAKNPHKGILE